MTVLLFPTVDIALGVLGFLPGVVYLCSPGVYLFALTHRAQWVPKAPVLSSVTLPLVFRARSHPSSFLTRVFFKVAKTVRLSPFGNQVNFPPS